MLVVRSLVRLFSGPRTTLWFRLHDLRHTVATRMIESGFSIVAVKEILGHASLDMTMRYAHPNETLRNAMESLSKYFSNQIGHKSGHITNELRKELGVSSRNNW